MRNYKQIGIQAPEVLLPAKTLNYSQWAVVACDQYTSQPDYWETVEKIVGTSPSTYRMILPEAFLGSEKEKPHQEKINITMREYVENNVLYPVEGFIFTERSIGNTKRRGLMTALDLEQYSFQKGSKSLIRATEGTIIDRLPPRIKIRENALLEIPHILVLIDDPQKTVIEPLSELKNQMTPLYNFELMQQGGHLEGYLISDFSVEKQIVSALEALLQPQQFQRKYKLPEGEAPFLFAVGDGNHSLATAKSVWEEIKRNNEVNNLARYALVELVNIHDPALCFEPIHRLLINPRIDLRSSIEKHFSSDSITAQRLPDFPSMKARVLAQERNIQNFGLITQDGFWLYQITKTQHALTVGSVQEFLDALISKNELDSIDYVHGDEAILKLSTQKNQAGIFLPVMQKSQLFEAVIKDGELPRKTFSMGEANEKRFYLECRKIQSS